MCHQMSGSPSLLPMNMNCMPSRIRVRTARKDVPARNHPRRPGPKSRGSPGSRCPGWLSGAEAPSADVVIGSALQPGRTDRSDRNPASLEHRCSRAAQASISSNAGSSGPCTPAGGSCMQKFTLGANLLNRLPPCFQTGFLIYFLAPVLPPSIFCIMLPLCSVRQRRVHFGLHTECSPQRSGA